MQLELELRLGKELGLGERVGDDQRSGLARFFVPQVRSSFAPLPRRRRRSPTPARRSSIWTATVCAPRGAGFGGRWFEGDCENRRRLNLALCLLWGRGIWMISLPRFRARVALIFHHRHLPTHFFCPFLAPGYVNDLTVRGAESP